MKERYFPSGLQAGLPAEYPSAVMAMGSPPAVGTLQMRVSPEAEGDAGVLTV